MTGGLVAKAFDWRLSGNICDTDNKRLLVRETDQYVSASELQQQQLSEEQAPQQTCRRRTAELPLHSCKHAHKHRDIYHTIIPINKRFLLGISIFIGV